MSAELATVTIRPEGCLGYHPPCPTAIVTLRSAECSECGAVTWPPGPWESADMVLRAHKHLAKHHDGVGRIETLLTEAEAVAAERDANAAEKAVASA